MKKNIYQFIFLFFSTFLILSCEKSSLDENIVDSQEVNYKTNFPESISFPENSIDAVLLDISDDNGISMVTTDSSAFSITKINGLWYIEPSSALDFETSASTNIIIKVTDELGNQESKSISVNITDVDEYVSPKLPITIELHNPDGSLIYTQSYQYDTQDRPIRYDYNYASSPEIDLYILTNYSGNTATAKIYKTQTNELSSYSVTTSSASNKPITVEHYAPDGSLSITQSFQYDTQDRQIRYDLIYPVYPESESYILTNYSGNTSTSKSYKTQTNELISYYVTTSSASNKPITVKHYAPDGSLSITQSFQYDTQDRQIKYDLIYPVYPESESYILTNYSGNTSTAKSYKTQTNELISYTVTTYKE